MTLEDRIAVLETLWNLVGVSFGSALYAYQAYDDMNNIPLSLYHLGQTTTSLRQAQLLYLEKIGAGEIEQFESYYTQFEKFLDEFISSGFETDHGLQHTCSALGDLTQVYVDLGLFFGFLPGDEAINIADSSIEIKEKIMQIKISNQRIKL